MCPVNVAWRITLPISATAQGITSAAGTLAISILGRTATGEGTNSGDRINLRPHGQTLGGRQCSPRRPNSKGESASDLGLHDWIVSSQLGLNREWILGCAQRRNPSQA